MAVSFAMLSVKGVGYMISGEYLDFKVVFGLFVAISILGIFIVRGTHFLLKTRYRRSVRRASQPVLALGRTLRNSDEPSWKRKLAAKSLGAMSAQGAVTELVSFFGPEVLMADRGTVEAAIKALDMTNSPRAMECLGEYVTRLVLLCGNPTQPNMGKVLGRESVSKTGKLAVKVLAASGGASAGPALRRASEAELFGRQAKKALRKIEG